MEVDDELIEILDKVKEKMKNLTYSALDNISNREATKVLAKIIKEEKINI